MSSTWFWSGVSNGNGNNAGNVNLDNGNANWNNADNPNGVLCLR